MLQRSLFHLGRGNPAFLYLLLPCPPSILLLHLQARPIYTGIIWPVPSVLVSWGPSSLCLYHGGRPACVCIRGAGESVLVSWGPESMW